MAPTPNPAAAPMPNAGDEPEAAGAPEDQSEQVLFTVLKNPNGGYTLMQGDEPDGGTMESEEPAGQTFDTPGELLKACLDILKQDEQASPNSAQSSFEAGFGSSSEPTPKGMS